MDAPPDLRQLEEVARRLAIPVRYEPGDMRGGLCRLGRQWQIIVNADLDAEEKAEVLAESLAQAPFDTVFVPPRIRDVLERLRERQP